MLATGILAGMGRMFHLASHHAIGLALTLCMTTGCGRSTPAPEQAQPRAIEDPAELAQLESATRSKPKRQTPKWKRAPPPMPETFAAFERPQLARLDGAWLVESEIPGQRVLWIIEEAGTKLIEVDHRGRERVFGLSLSSPCALRLTDERGQTRTRVIAMRDPVVEPGQADAGVQLVSPQPGAAAIMGRDGSMLACVGHRTYQIAADGRCRYTTEMLGAWTEPSTPSEACELTRDESGRVLVIDEQRLREQDGLWIVEGSDLARATKVDNREAGLAALKSL